MAQNDLDLDALKSVVIVKPSSLGDIVHTLPLLALLRRNLHPETKIEWVVNDVWAPLLRGHPLLDGLIEFPRQKFRGVGGMARMWRWLGTQRERRPDLALDIQGLLRSGLIARSMKAGRVFGYDDSREGARWLHSDLVEVAQKRSPHAVERYLTFFTHLGIELPSPAELEFPLPNGDEPSRASELPESFVIVHPFSRGDGKSLTIEQTRRLSQELDGSVVVVGRVEEDPGDLGANTINLLNKTSLAELIWLLRRAKFVVSVDSGPMHLAAAATPNVLSIHTWSDPRKVGPYRAGAHVWKDGKITSVNDYSPDEQSGSTSFPDSAVSEVAEFVNQQREQKTS